LSGGLTLNKVLVCITPQANGTRLIDKGHEISLHTGTELHILHVEQNNSIFYTEESARMLDDLFRYGSERGGVVHAVCGRDPFKTIKHFIKDEDVTDVVLGESPEAGSGFSERLYITMPHIRLHVLYKSLPASI
jgi:K+-sensing histidine kinase KdpD